MVTKGFGDIAMDDVALKAAAVRPSPRQLAWQKLEFEAFIHFSINTFTGREWGDGKEDPRLFNPTQLDARQWAQVCVDAGIRSLILTAKHHDGFCLWPSRLTDHTVAASPWKGGRGDVVGEVAKACREFGLQFGIYVSPWDRHEPSYGTPDYNDFFKGQLRELLTNYGDIYCVWFDGACGEGPNGKRQVYDWDGYYQLIRELQPGAVISVCGPDVRWCGNEAGHTRESEWSVVPASMRDNEKVASESQQEEGYAFSQRVNTSDRDLGSRDVIRGVDELVWYPAEVNTSIRPGWYYHAEQDDQVKSLAHLLDVYYGSVGGNAVFLLNFPPDRRGLIHENDAARAKQLGDVLRETFRVNYAQHATVTASETREPREDGGGHGSRRYDAAHVVDGDENTFWMPDDGTEQAVLELALPELTTFNTIELREHIPMGQRIERFRVDVYVNDSWCPVAEATTVGYKRLLRIDNVTTDRVRVHITASRVCPTVQHIGLYRRPQ